MKPHEGFVDLLSPEFEKILIEIKKGWASNINPVLTENGTSGTYLLKSLSKANLVYSLYDFLH